MDLGKDHNYFQQRRQFLTMRSGILPVLTSVIFRAPWIPPNALLLPIDPPLIYPFLVHPEHDIYRFQYSVNEDEE